MNKLTVCIGILLMSSLITVKAQFQQSKLPIFVFSTNGGEITKDSKIMVDLKVYYDAGGAINSIIEDTPHFDGKSTIKFRGSSSLVFPKKSYSIELADSDGEELSFPLLGFPEEAEWTLIANYDDKSYLKNAYVYDLWGKTGRYSPRTMHAEVIINGQYMGLYVMTEKIKRDSERVDIKKLEAKDTSATAITGGYMIEASRESENIVDDYIWTSEYKSSPSSAFYMNFECIYPKKPTNIQLNYLKKYMKDFETSLKSADFKDPDIGFRNYIDENSFVDNFVIQEYSIHLDVFSRSQFFYKDRGKKMVASPLWDASYGLFENYTNAWRFSCSACDPRFFWVERMMEDCNFKSRVIEQYKTFRRSFLSIQKSHQYIDSVVTVIQEAAARDRAKWHSSSSATFANEVQLLKSFVTKRINWMDDNIHAIKGTGKTLASTYYDAFMGQQVILTSTCPPDYPVEWTFETKEGETGTFSGTNIQNVMVTQPVSYYAKCNTTCPDYTNLIRINLISNCADNLNISSNAVNPPVQNFKSKGIITANAAVATNTTTSYSAAKSIVLTEGFIVPKGNVFVAKIDGCE